MKNTIIRTAAACFAAVIFAALILNITQDTRKTADYIRSKYGDIDIIYTQYTPGEIMEDRTGKAVVQIIKSRSTGKQGITEDGSIIPYNRYTKPGKTVTSYLVYNPENNAPDDVTAVIDHGIIR